MSLFGLQPLQKVILSCLKWTFLNGHELLSCLILKNILVLLRAQIRFMTTTGATALSLEEGGNWLQNHKVECQWPLAHVKVSCKCEAILVIFTVTLVRTEIL